MALILSVGMPRAGSGWYYNLTQDLVTTAGGISARTIRKRYHLEKLLTEVNCNIGTLSFYRLLPVMIPGLFEPTYVIKLHAERRPLADLFIRQGWIKPTFIYRDPRDALLSAFEYGQRMREKNLTNAFTHLTSIEKAVDFMEDYVEIAEGWITMPGCLVVKYEHLLSNYDQEVQRLMTHLDIQPDRGAIQQVMDKYRPAEKTPQQQGLHFVHGVKGRHVRHLTPAQLDLCDQKFGRFLARHGYE